MLHGVLQILHDAFLADNLLDPSLGIDIERVRIEQGDLALALVPLSPLPVEAVGEQPRKPLGVLQRGD